MALHKRFLSDFALANSLDTVAWSKQANEWKKERRNNKNEMLKSFQKVQVLRKTHDRRRIMKKAHRNVFRSMCAWASHCHSQDTWFMQGPSCSIFLYVLCVCLHTTHTYWIRLCTLYPVLSCCVVICVTFDQSYLIIVPQ